MSHQNPSFLVGSPELKQGLLRESGRALQKADTKETNKQGPPSSLPLLLTPQTQTATTGKDEVSV